MTERCMPSRKRGPVHDHAPNEGRGLDCPETRVNGQLRGACMLELERYTLVDETVTVDGVEYDEAAVRALVLERHHQAEEIIQLRLRVDTLLDRLRRADSHLRYRTAALARLVARKGPVL